MDIDRTFLRKLRLLGVIEGLSTLVLFGIAMPMKYLGGMPMAVTVVGSIHGGLFIALCAMFLVGWTRIPLSRFRMRPATGRYSLKRCDITP